MKFWFSRCSLDHSLAWWYMDYLVVQLAASDRHSFRGMSISTSEWALFLRYFHLFVAVAAAIIFVVRFHMIVYCSLSPDCYSIKCHKESELANSHLQT